MLTPNARDRRLTRSGLGHAWRASCCAIALTLFVISAAEAQIPPLPGMGSRHRKRPPKRKQPGPFETPLAKSILVWGKAFRKKLPKGWKMHWASSRLRSLRWMANHQPGFRIRFVKPKEKVVVPVPFPKFGARAKNIKVIPRRCSLHFYPREGLYRAHHSLIARLAPARIIAITKKYIVFQPDRFQAMEYPCPKLLKRFKQYAKATAKGRPWRKQLPASVQKTWLKKARLFRHHVEITLGGSRGARRAIAKRWRKILRRASRETLVVHQNDQGVQRMIIYNTKKMKQPFVKKRLPPWKQ